MQSLGTQELITKREVSAIRMSNVFSQGLGEEKKNYIIQRQ